MKKIKYQSEYTTEELETLLRNLSEALNRALVPLQSLEDCGAEDIADDEASYVQEMAGFIHLVKLVEEEEFTEACRSLNRACWEIEVAEEEEGTTYVDHPWLGESIGGSYPTQIFHEMHTREFSALDYDPTPDEEAQNLRSELERQERLSSGSDEETRDFQIDPWDPNGLSDF
jgi:hypothetical protein